MNVTFRRSTIKGEVSAPASKSAAHRLAIACMLAGQMPPVEAYNDDIAATLACSAAILNKIGGGQDRLTLDAGESGSTLRFLLPVVCALGLDATFKGRGRLPMRPLDGLLNVLKGVKFTKPEQGYLPLEVSGRLESGTFEVDGSVSSQYVTGLLFALPLIDGDSSIQIVGKRASESYVEMTLDTLRRFGICVERTANGFFVRGGQRYVVPANLSVEGDWSSASFMLGLGALAGEVAVKGLDEKSAQGDRRVASLLMQAGADISCKDGAYIAKKSPLKAISFDATDIPDAVPVMAAVLSFAEGVSTISGVDRLRFKESDRVEAVRNMLAEVGVRTKYDCDTLYIYGGGHKVGVMKSFGDHRIAMSAALIALTMGGGKVCGMECASKSYPQFLEHLKALGAQLEVEDEGRI